MNEITKAKLEAGLQGRFDYLSARTILVQVLHEAGLPDKDLYDPNEIDAFCKALPRVSPRVGQLIKKLRVWAGLEAPDDLESEAPEKPETKKAEEKKPETETKKAEEKKPETEPEPETKKAEEKKPEPEPEPEPKKAEEKKPEPEPEPEPKKAEEKKPETKKAEEKKPEPETKKTEEKRPEAPKGPVSVQFLLSGIELAPDETACIIGNIAELGEWDASKAVTLKPSKRGPLVTEIPLAVGTKLEFKFFVRPAEGENRWEGGDNRSFEVPAERNAEFTAIWQD